MMILCECKLNNTILLQEDKCLNSYILVFLIYSLKSVKLDTVSASSNSTLTLPTVEKCACPSGYHGLSCEVRPASSMTYFDSS